MKSLSRPSLLLLAASLFSVTVAFAGARWDRVPQKDHNRTSTLAAGPESAAAGANLYRDHCQQCHGATAQGDGRKKPSLRTEHISQATDGDLEWFLRQGDLAHGMPSWSGIPEAQRWQIIAYLRSLK